MDSWDDCLKPMLGLPYTLNGRADEGVDCLGLIIFAYRQQGFNVDFLDNKYSHEVSPLLFMRDFRRFTKPSKRRPGSIILVRDCNRAAVHLAIQGEEFAYHSDRFRGVCLLDTIDSRSYYDIEGLGV